MPPDPDPNANPNPAPKPPAVPETFSREYVHELREESKSWRQRHQESEAKRVAAEEAAAKASKEADEKIKGANTQAEQRVIRAELKAVALKAGMIDLDGLKLADLSKVTLDKDGEVQGADEMIAALKKAKPYLFGEPSTGTGRPPPKPGDPKPKLATEMSKQEYEAARRAAIRGGK